MLRSCRGGSKFPPGSCGPSRAQGTRPPTRPPAPAARPPSGFICVPSFSSCNFQASAGSARSRGRSVNDYRHRRSEQPRPTGAVGQSALQAGRRGGGRDTGVTHGITAITPRLAAGQEPGASGRGPRVGFPPALAPRAAGNGEASACGVQGFRTRPGCAKLTRQSDFPARHAPVAGDARQPGRPDATGDGHGAVTARATQPGTTQSPCPVLSHAARHTHAVSPCRTSPTHARPTRPAGPVTWHTLSPRLCVIPAHARPAASSSRAVPPGFIPLHPCLPWAARRRCLFSKTPFFFLTSACRPRPRQHLGGRRAGKGLITCPHRSPHGPRRFLLQGGHRDPFHLPRGCSRCCRTRLGTTKLPFAGEKQPRKRGPGPAAPLGPCAQLQNEKKNLIHTPLGTHDGARVEARLVRCHRVARSTAVVLEGFVGLCSPCPHHEARG